MIFAMKLIILMKYKNQINNFQPINSDKTQINCNNNVVKNL